MQVLVDAGADINFIDGYGYTPLHVAVNYNQSESAKRLVDLGADLAEVDKVGLTPLGLAKLYNYDEIIAILKAAGAPE